MNMTWEIQTLHGAGPTTPPFSNLAQVRGWLIAQGITTGNDKGWVVRETLNGVTQEIAASFVVSDQMLGEKSIGVFVAKSGR
jgi:hypothetical protein